MLIKRSELVSEVWEHKAGWIRRKEWCGCREKGVRLPSSGSGEL